MGSPVWLCITPPLSCVLQPSNGCGRTRKTSAKSPYFWKKPVASTPSSSRPRPHRRAPTSSPCSRYVLVSRDQRAEAVALIAAFCAAVASVVVFFPAEGRVLVPVHATIEFLLGRMSFVLPLGLGLA